MNENLPPKTQTINAWLKEAVSELKSAKIKSAGLDAELILANTLRKDRTYIHAHDTEVLAPRFLQIANARIALRKDRVPLAYILGGKDFYGRWFKITPAVLVPRPETEQFIELIKDLIPKNRHLFDSTPELVDVGTGSGVIGISAKLELPDLNVTLMDIDRHALNIAKENAKLLDAEVKTDTSNLLDKYYKQADIIVANLPYVDRDWSRPRELDYEPQNALYAHDDGLGLIKKLLLQARHKLKPTGMLLLESDQRQQLDIRRFARENGYKVVKTHDLITVLKLAN